MHKLQNKLFKPENKILVVPDSSIHAFGSYGIALAAHNHLKKIDCTVMQSHCKHNRVRRKIGLVGKVEP